MFDVSIIIPVYEAKYTIKKTLESINNQKYKNGFPKIELILSIDDNKNYEKYRSMLNNEIINTTDLGHNPRTDVIKIGDFLKNKLGQDDQNPNRSRKRKYQATLDKYMSNLEHRYPEGN